MIPDDLDSGSTFSPRDVTAPDQSGGVRPAPQTRSERHLTGSKRETFNRLRVTAPASPDTAMVGNDHSQAGNDPQGVTSTLVELTRECPLYGRPLCPNPYLHLSFQPT